jgi:type IV pilus assembly protein PilQ
VTIQFETGKEAASLPKEPMDATIQGETTETIESTARDRSTDRSGKSTPKDLLANLPKNPITIDFDDADVRDVIRVLSEMSGINMIYAADLRGFVTVHLNQVPFNEVFTTVLSMQGLVSQQIGNNILRILTPDALTVDRNRAVVTYRTFLLNYGKASEIATHLAAVRVNASGRVTVDDRNNALVVTDTPEGLAAAERLISELDRKPAQVLIETKLVQIDLDKSLDLGIQWEYGSNRPLGNGNPNNRRLIGQRFIDASDPLGTNREITSSAGKIGFSGVDSAGANSITYPADSANRGTGVSLPGPTAAGISFGFINSSEMLTATLGALETERTAKTLTNPKIITTNNQPANIQIGSRVPFLQTTVSPGGTATQSTVFANVGFIIDVTPTINEDNQIRLKVKPESSSVTGITDSGPTIKTTSADTEVILKDGDTIVIGGLVSDSNIESVKKVPLLGDLPVLGVFFRSLSTSKVRQELLVFITARIVPN